MTHPTIFWPDSYPNRPSYSPENLLTQQSSSSAASFYSSSDHSTQIDPPTQPTSSSFQRCHSQIQRLSNSPSPLEIWLCDVHGFDGFLKGLVPPINVVPRVGPTISYGLRTVEIRDSKWDDVRVALFLRNPTWMSMRTPRTG